jgi:hypothetical protein
MEKERQYLGWLAYGFYAMSALFILFALFSVVFLVFGVLFLTTDVLEEAGNPEHAAYVFGALNILVSLLFFAGGAVLAFLTFRMGRNLQRRENYKFCLIAAIVICLFSPFGLILGILTIVVLTREPVRDLFENAYS